MRFAVDLVWLDRAGRVLRIDPGVGPWRLRWCRGAHSVLELPRGGAGAQGWRPGQPVRQVGAVAWGLALCPGVFAVVWSMLLAGAGLPAQAAAPLQDEADGPIVFEWPIYSVRGRRMSRALSAEKFAWEDWTKIRNLGIYDNTVLYMDFEHHAGHLSLGYKTGA
jgi:hypothetical protein